MTEPIIRATINAVRGNAWGDPLTPGSALALPRPEKFLKETRETLVWTGETALGMTVFYKMYRHRSLPSWWKEHLSRFRAEREYDRMLVLHQAGVPCCEPLICAHGRSAEDGRFEIVGTREIPHARKLAHYLNAAKEDGFHPQLSALFDTIRQMHAAGVWHGTLTPNNIVASEPPDGHLSFHVVDLPRAVDYPYDIAYAKMGWCDLMHFVHRTSAFIPADACMGVLDVYGFSAEQRRCFETELARYRPSKGLRYRWRNAFGFLGWWDKKTGRQRARSYKGMFDQAL